jgi:hypothetical protein
MMNLLILASFAGCLLCQAFVVPPVATRNQLSPKIQGQSINTSIFLAQQRKRRRRKSSPDEGSDDLTDDFDVNNNSNELPDFDVDGEEPKPKKASGNPDEITDAMMGDAKKSVRSINELLSDRSLESKFEFEETEEGSSLPDFAVVAQAKAASRVPEPEVPGTKKARKAERVAAAIAAKEEKEEEESFFAKFSFLTDEKGEISGVKILESGAWLGIYSLVGWEVYLNSPLFDRAAPLSPVVYNFLM